MLAAVPLTSCTTNSTPSANAGEVHISTGTPQGVRVIATTRDNDDVADLMLRSGFAWYRNDTVNELRYIRSERFAQEEGVGIWASPDHVAPWEWRKRHVEK